MSKIDKNIEDALELANTIQIDKDIREQIKRQVDLLYTNNPDGLNDKRKESIKLANEVIFLNLYDNKGKFLQWNVRVDDSLLIEKIYSFSMVKLDVFFSLNTFRIQGRVEFQRNNPKAKEDEYKKYQRLKKLAYKSKAILVDIDYYNKEEYKDKSVNEMMEIIKLEKKNILDKLGRYDFICSGNGLYLLVYTKPFYFPKYIYDEDNIYNQPINVKRDLWKGISRCLCNIFKNYGSDTKVASDEARVFRPMQSYNYKNDNEKQVYLLESNGKVFKSLKDLNKALKEYGDINPIEEEIKPVKRKLKPYIEGNKVIHHEVENVKYNAANTDFKYTKLKVRDISKKKNTLFNERLYFVEEIVLNQSRRYDVKGFRNSFIFVIARLYENNYIQKNEALEHCLEINELFVEHLTYQEIYNIVEFTYMSHIRISNEGIQKKLDITQEEQHMFHNQSYFIEHKRAKKKIQNQKNYEEKKQREVSTMDIKYQKYFQILEQNPNSTVKQLTVLMELSERQVQRIKSKYKEFIKEQREIA